MESDVEVSIWYRTSHGTIPNLHKVLCPKYDLVWFISEIIAKGFRRADAGGYIHQYPASAVLEVIWKDENERTDS